MVELRRVHNWHSSVWTMNSRRGREMCTDGKRISEMSQPCSQTMVPDAYKPSSPLFRIRP